MQVVPDEQRRADMLSVALVFAELAGRVPSGGEP